MNTDAGLWTMNDELGLHLEVPSSIWIPFDSMDHRRDKSPPSSGMIGMRQMSIQSRFESRFVHASMNPSREGDLHGPEHLSDPSRVSRDPNPESNLKSPRASVSGVDVHSRLSRFLGILSPTLLSQDFLLERKIPPGES
ncbi:hypothetical protein N7512_007016 [Penicillium capsulatum]|nr:hypothetical protein N7512_007016 [Penicillium capsulatum]